MYNVDGTEMAGWGVTIVSPDILLESCVAPSCAIPVCWRSLEPRPAATTELNTLVLLRLFVG